MHLKSRFVAQDMVANSTMPFALEDSTFGIRIGRIGFLASSSLFWEVIAYSSIQRLANVAPWVSGLLNVRGNPVPVFDLHVLLSEALPEPENRRLYIIGEGNHAAALWIDGAPEVKSGELFQPVEELAALPVTQQEGQVWFKINFEDLFMALGRHHYRSEDVGV